MVKNMNYYTYLAIFLFKIIENTLSTLRLIIVAKGKKFSGAILQFIISIIWVISTGIVVHNLNDDPYKILFFALGSLIGSYVGGLIEEKIALGYDLITIYEFNDIKFSNNYIIKLIKNKNNIQIISKKKNRNKIIKTIDKSLTITIESIKLINK